MPGPPLYLRQNLSEPNLPLSLVLRAIPPRPSRAISGIVFWRWEDKPAMQPVVLGEVTAGERLEVPFNLDGKAVRLFVLGRTAKGQLSSLRPEDGAQAVVTGPSVPPPASQTFKAAENLSARDIVNIFNDTNNVPSVRKAFAGVGDRPADGFVMTPAVAGAMVSVELRGTITGLTGLTPGQTLYLSDVTPGAFETEPPTEYYHLEQVIGTAASATSINFSPQTGILILPPPEG